MMTPKELEEHLAHLKLDQAEASQLLGINPRTLRRWFEGEEVPGSLRPLCAHGARCTIAIYLGSRTWSLSSKTTRTKLKFIGNTASTWRLF